MEHVLHCALTPGVLRLSITSVRSRKGLVAI